MEQAGLETELMVQVCHRALQHTKIIRCTPLTLELAVPLHSPSPRTHLYAPRSLDIVVPACPSPRFRQR